MSFAQRVTLNAAVYHIDWSDLQSQVFMAALKNPSVPVSSCTFETIFNVGDATIQGLELELTARVTDRLRLDASLALTEPEYDSSYPQIGIIEGETMEGTPDLQSFLGLQYDFNVFQRRAFARVDWTHVGDIEPRGTDFIVQAQPYPIGNFDTLNARVGLNLTDQLRLDVWVDNLTDEFGVTRSIDLAGDGLPTIFTIRPRTAGLTLRWDFGGN
jgi:iron complex outermembrane receptor protein